MVKVTDSDPTAFLELVERSVEGRQLDFTDTDLATCSDEASIRKIYKLQVSSKSGSKAPVRQVISEEARHDLEISILGLMALRGAS